MAIDDSIDILENTLRKKGELLDILLCDRTTGRLYQKPAIAAVS